MPIHDWTRVAPGTFHFFHQRWIQAVCDVLNSGLLPSGFFAMSERIITDEDAPGYAQRADRISTRLAEGEPLAVIEIVSPGNKNRIDLLQSFVLNARGLIRRGVHLLILDLFPPDSHTTDGIHPLIWRSFSADVFSLPSEKPLTFVSYEASEEKAAYIESVAVGDSLPDMPIFLAPGRYILCPLEATYQTTWNVFPKELKVHFS